MALKNASDYYGENTSLGNDKNCGDAVLEAVEAMADVIDWSLYDSNGDGTVDDVVVIYAGNSEYSGGGDNAILPKSYLLMYDKYTDSKYNRKGAKIGKYYINSYTLINELADDHYDGIGTFVHEFMHGMGLADVYTTYEAGAAYTPRFYDVMDVGIYNNDSKTPPTTSSFERYALGWIEPEVITGPCEITLPPLLDSNKACLIPISQTEFYMLENRQQASWDTYLPGHGMLIWHIHYSENIWYNNSANKTETHQRIDLVEACGEYSTSSSVTSGYPFPGTQGVTSHTPMAWNGSDLGLTITDIKEAEDGTVTATIAELAGISDAIIDGSGKIQYSDLQGRPIASPTAPGIYIQRQGSTSRLIKL